MSAWHSTLRARRALQPIQSLHHLNSLYPQLSARYYKEDTKHKQRFMQKAFYCTKTDENQSEEGTQSLIMQNNVSEDKPNKEPTKPPRILTPSEVVKIAERAAEQCFRLAPNDASPYLILRDIYLKYGDLASAAKITQQMKDKGLKKVPGRTSIGVNENIHFFVGGKVNYYLMFLLKKGVREEDSKEPQVSKDEVKNGREKKAKAEKRKKKKKKIGKGKPKKKDKEAPSEGNNNSRNTDDNVGVMKFPNLDAIIPPIVRPRSTEPTGDFAVLPQEVILIIFQNLDVKSLCIASEVCGLWFASVPFTFLNNTVRFKLAGDKVALASLLVQKHIQAALKYLASLKSVAQRISKTFTNDSNAVSRGQFLLETVESLSQYLEGRIKSNEEIPVAPFNHLMLVFNHLVKTSLQIFDGVLTGDTEMNENYDIVELALRRYLAQFQELFPLSPRKMPAHPADVITDSRARLLWEECVGKDNYFCEYQEFYFILEVRGIAKKKIMQDALLYFLNFPKDNTVTPFKWECLMRMFGPYESFLVNFTTVLHQGFLGLINRLRSDELLHQFGKEGNADPALIRMSRVNPKVLVLSFMTAGEVEHSLTTCEEINDRIKKQNLFLIPLRLNSSAVGEMQDLYSYLNSSTGGYIEPSS